jgi:hypothetical protein
MTTPHQDADYYFDDRNAPDGWREYHLQRRGEVLELVSRRRHHQKRRS